MHRFFLPTLQPKVGDVISLRAIHSQLFRVLRVQPGEQVLMLDNAGSEWLLEIESVDRRDVLARVVKMRPAPAEPALAVTLYQCLLRSDKFDLVLQKATELGVTTIVPVVSNRTLMRLGRRSPKQSRWDSIVREAAEQSGRGAIPTVSEPCSFAEAIANATGTRLLPWEEAKSTPGLLGALVESPQPVTGVSILIGPEGGLEATEVKEAKVAGWHVVSLGKRILRAETAAVTALSVAMLALGELGDSPLAKFAPPDVESDVARKGTKAETKTDASEKASATADRGEAKRTEAAATEETGADEARKAAPPSRAKATRAKPARAKSVTRKSASNQETPAQTDASKRRRGGKPREANPAT